MAGTMPLILRARPVCPRCTSIEFQPAETHRLDLLMAALRFSPIRCVNCRRRYYWLIRKNMIDQMNVAHP
jgi:hypothetical protein